MNDGLEIITAKGHSATEEWSDVIEIVKDGKRLLCVIALSGQLAYKRGEDIRVRLFNLENLDSEGIYGFIQELVTDAEAQELLISCSVLLFEEKAVLLIANKGTITLLRHKTVKTLLHPTAELAVIQGSFQAGDTFIAATTEAAQLVEVITGYIETMNVTTAFEQVTPTLYQLDKSSIAAVASVIITANELSPVPGVTTSLPTERSASRRHTLRFNFSGLKAISTSLGNIGSTLKQVTLGGKQQLERTLSKDTYVSADKKFNKKSIFTVLMVLLTIGLMIGTTLYMMTQQKANDAQAQTLLQPYQTRLTEIEATATTDPIVARPQVSQVVAELTELANQHQENKDVYEKIIAQKTEAEALFSTISGKEAVQELTVFYDLRLISPNFVTFRGHAFGDMALFLDQDKQHIVKLNLSSKQAETIPVADGEVLKDIAVTENSFVVLGKGIFEHAFEQNASFTRLVDEGDSNRDSLFIGTFDTYIYIFNAVKRNIYRYARSGDTTSDPIGWLQSSKGIDFATVDSMSIDGDIWLTTSAGEIKKLTRGQPVEFTISGLSDPFSTSLKLYTTESLPYLFVLEPSKKRVVILTKNGEFFKEIQNVSLGSATEIFGHPPSNKVLVVSGSIIYEIGY